VGVLYVPLAIRMTRRYSHASAELRYTAYHNPSVASGVGEPQSSNTEPCKSATGTRVPNVPLLEGGRGADLESTEAVGFGFVVVKR
jgi:hypothetical protein